MTADQSEWGGLRRDTVETPVDVERQRPTFSQLTAAVTREVQLPTPTREVVRSARRSEVLLQRLAIGAPVVSLLAVLVSWAWPAAPVEQRAWAVRPAAASRPPPPVPPALEPALEPLDVTAILPPVHRVDTLAVHGPELATQALHRYLLSVDRLPTGALVTARVETNGVFGEVLALSPARVLAVHGVTRIRLHCEPPARFTAETRLSVTVVDTATQETWRPELAPDTDCLDLSAGRVVRLDGPQRLALSADVRARAQVAWRFIGEGGWQAGKLSPGESVRLEAGLVQLAVVSHTTGTTEPFHFEVLPPDVESPLHHTRYLMPTLTEPPRTVERRAAPRQALPDIWPPLSP